MERTDITLIGSIVLAGVNVKQFGHAVNPFPYSSFRQRRKSSLRKTTFVIRNDMAMQRKLCPEQPKENVLQ